MVIGVVVNTSQKLIQHPFLGSRSPSSRLVAALTARETARRQLACTAATCPEAEVHVAQNQAFILAKRSFQFRRN